MSAPVSANARSSVEINDSCNDCCPRFCCFERKHKHIKRRNASSDLSVAVTKADAACKSALQQVDPIPKRDSVKYGDMTALPGGSK